VMGPLSAKDLATLAVEDAQTDCSRRQRDICSGDDLRLMHPKLESRLPSQLTVRDRCSAD
jgi:hypothetical protein